MIVMARTKKQTLENASERKRQIQEEILRETLAAKQKKENSLVTRSHSNNPGLVATAASSHNKVLTSGSLDLDTKNGEFAAAKFHEDVLIKTVINNVTAGKHTNNMSTQNPSPKDTSSMSKADLMKAVICIPDICRSPTKSHDDDSSRHSSRDSSPRGKASVGPGSGGQKDGTNKKNHESPKQVDVKSSTASKLLKSLKAASEKVREERSKKSQQKSPPAAKIEVSSSPPSAERRSPRQQSPKHNHSFASSDKNIKESRLSSDERPKVNIFTENLGVDLGKRIRSPRRLSEDMIALPIFSVRRWSNCVKESTASTFVAEKDAGDNVSPSNAGFSTSSSVSNDSFKSPNCSPSPSKKSSGSPQYSGSKNNNTTGSQDKNQISKGHCETPVRSQKQRGKSRESSPHSASEQNKKSDPSQHEQTQSKSYPLRNSKCADFKDVHFHQESKTLENEKQMCHDGTKTGSNNTSDLMKNTCSDIVKDSMRKKTDRSINSEVHKEKAQVQINEDVEKLMSSICREIMCDMIKSKNIDKSVEVEEPGIQIGPPARSDSCDKEGHSSCEKSCDLLENICAENTSVTPSHRSVNSGQCNQGQEGIVIEDGSTDDKPQSSLLCAMLVGGTEVANSYSLERERCKPQVVDISDATVSSSKVVPQMNLNSTASVSNFESLKKEQGVKSITEAWALESCEHYETEPKGRRHPLGRSCVHPDDSVAILAMHAMNNINEEDTQIKQEISDSFSGQSVDTENKDKHRKSTIDFAGKLKSLDENVLKLLDIDVEEEFLQDLDVDDSPDSRYVCQEICDKSLYELITNLWSRLRNADNVMPHSVPMDVDVVQKLIQSCPEITPRAVPKLKTDARMNKISIRLIEEQKKESFVINKKMPGELTSNTTREPKQQAVLSENSSFDDQNIDAKNKVLCEEIKCEKQDVQNSLKQDLIEDNDDRHTEGMLTEPLEMTTSSSSLNDSLCDMDVDALTSAVTKSVSLGMVNEGHDSIRLDTNTGDPKSLDTCIAASNMETKETNSSNVQTAGKYLFQKSKTCDDFNECPSSSSSSSSHAGTLRRVNSSPQINSKIPPSTPSSPSSLLNSGRDSHVKSKLGSKIPVPGTSYVSKAFKKTWRTPSIIREPKPLAVLSELEESSSSAKNIFTCPNLQKYLNIPSNRIIVRPDQREEMKNLDAQVKQEEEEKQRQTKNREGKDKKSDEEINSDFKKYEPDFDEVDGMLFMSFATEIELQAHVRVEKALEWDKDDTMLRVSRAKAFEEAKAHNEDMGEFKLKHLRGQHMRWKKYRRLYSSEVKALLEAKEKGIPINSLPKKTSDVSKIKGWKRKQSQAQESMVDIGRNHSQSSSTLNVSSEIDSSRQSIKQEISLCEDSIGWEDDGNMFISPHSKRRQGFSHQKAHKQLFRELNMDWEDRMIHRKLGGWSLKGNRPRAFSRAAIKRQEKKSKESGFVKFDPGDIAHIEQEFQEDLDSEEIYDAKDLDEGPKRKKMMRLIYPLLTEKMARNALKTLAIEDVCGRVKKMKKSHRPNLVENIPNLTPIKRPDAAPSDSPRTPLSGVSTHGSSTPSTLSTPPPPLSQSIAPSVSASSTPLTLDLPEEPVTEGVDIAVEGMSSPSLADTSSSKSCGKPGCRYGCICHLCSASEASIPPPSPAARRPAPACEKEYCRLGCICDSIDPEKPIANQSHCGKSSCMLQCICSEAGSLDGNDDIPYLPSMKRRPKPGERFLNLPQREKTHRSAKNLDAITRKAMMLYETSEIYCEKVERVKKKPDTASSPTVAPQIGTTPVTSVLAGPDMAVETDVSEYFTASEQPFKAETLFSAMNLTTSQKTSVPTSHLAGPESVSSQSNHDTRDNVPKVTNPAILIDDRRQTMPIVEPSVHKRKRKSHPLSDEIFSSSSCARTQCYKHRTCTTGTSATDESQGGSVCPVASSHKPETDCANTCVETSSDFKPIVLDDESDSGLPKIASVQSLAANIQGEGALIQWESTEHRICDGKSESGNNNNQAVANSAQKHHTLPGDQTQADEKVTGQSKQYQGWHKSMVCLKAKAASPSQISGEEDVQEKDEVKLLEFTANCNWEGAKKKILNKIAKCLTRGQYPQPRTMNVCEFVVEILPKAPQPSHIPPELRLKLPDQMYSIRIRVTRRESISNVENDSDVIDLSEPSPVKSGSGTIDKMKSTVSIAQNLNDTVSSAVHCSSAMDTSDPSLSSCSFGISGLSKLCINNSSLSGQAGMSQALNIPSKLNVHSRRRSAESVSNNKSLNKDEGNSTDGKFKGSSFVVLGNGSSMIAAINMFDHNSASVSANTAVTSYPKVSCTTSSKVASKERTNSQLTGNQSVKQMALPIRPHSYSLKDFENITIAAKDGMMKVIEVATTSDKEKKIIAVPVALSKIPVDLKGNKSSGPFVALSVGGAVPSKLVPLLPSQPLTTSMKTATSLSAPQQLLVRLPNDKATMPQGFAGAHLKHPVTMQSVQRRQKLQKVSVCTSNQVSSELDCKSRNQPNIASSMCVSSSCSRSLNSSDEMIMVFDAAHIKASKLTKSLTTASATVSKNRASEENLEPHQSAKTESKITSVTASRDRPIMSAEVSPTALKNNLDGAIDLTTDLAKDTALTHSDNITDSNGSKNSDDCGGCSSMKYLTEKDGDRSCGNPTGNQREDKSLILRTLPLSTSEERNSCGNTMSSESHTHAYSSLKIPLGIHASGNAPKILYESVVGTKRSRPSMADLEVHSLSAKKPCLAVEALSVNDDDSNVSVNSGLGYRLAAASPQSSVDRPTSVLSTAMSTGSSDDLLIMLSSDEEIDVGEESNNEQVMSQRERAERAIENDHGSMYIKTGAVFTLGSPMENDILASEGKKVGKNVPEEVAGLSQGEKGSSLRKVRSVPDSRTAHHNKLERLRRSKLRQLFDDLQYQVMYGRNVPLDNKEAVMSKAKVLSEAKKVIAELTESVEHGDQLVKQYEKQNQFLRNRLARMTAHLLGKTMTAESITTFLEKTGRNTSKKTGTSAFQVEAEGDVTKTLAPVTVENISCEDFEEGAEMVNLVSPSTEDDKVSERLDAITPVYEDISDPDESSAPKYEDISDVDETKYEDISDSDTQQKV